MLKFPYFPLVHPVINVRNQLVGSPFEKDVTIECNVEASPKSINYWIKDVKDGKFEFYTYSALNAFYTFLLLDKRFKMCCMVEKSW